MRARGVGADASAFHWFSRQLQVPLKMYAFPALVASCAWLLCKSRMADLLEMRAMVAIPLDRYLLP